MNTKTKFNKFWVVSLNNYICDAAYSGKELKAKHLFPSFRQFTFIRSWEDLAYFRVRSEISNRALVEQCLGIAESEPDNIPKNDTQFILEDGPELSKALMIKRNGVIELLFGEDQRELAELIVKACNNHQPLIEALEDFVKMYEKVQPAGGYQGVYEIALNLLNEIKNN